MSGLISEYKTFVYLSGGCDTNGRVVLKRSDPDSGHVPEKKRILLPDDINPFMVYFFKGRTRFCDLQGLSYV